MKKLTMIFFYCLLSIGFIGGFAALHARKRTSLYSPKAVFPKSAPKRSTPKKSTVRKSIFKNSYSKKAPYAGFGKVSEVNGKIKTKTTKGYFKPSNGYKFVNPYARSR